MGDGVAEHEAQAVRAGVLGGDEIAVDAAEPVALEAAKREENVVTYLKGGEMSTVVYVPGRISVMAGTKCD